jgi:hypothetical protein
LVVNPKFIRQKKPLKVEADMFKSLLFVPCILILIIFVAPSYGFDLDSMADQSTWRCPGGVVAIGDLDRDVRNKCGNPIEVARVQDVGPVWIYQPGQTKFMYYLAFLNGKLQRIASAPCRNNDPECYDLR